MTVSFTTFFANRTQILFLITIVLEDWFLLHHKKEEGVLSSYGVKLIFKVGILFFGILLKS